MREIVCAVCGKKIGRLDLYMHHEHGVVCCDCMLEHQYFLMDAVAPPKEDAVCSPSRVRPKSAGAGVLQLPLPFGW